jgi:thiol-disulfide isomerase/thioredoxin
MASWCKPCIEEFKEAKKFESFFKEKNIVKLFITIDMKENVESDFQLIQHDSLSGYFVSIPPQNEFNPMSFQQEIIDLFFKDDNGKIIISIPRYAIVNKKGKFVEKRAARPSDPVELKKQLEKYL